MVKGISLRLPEEVHASLQRVSDETRISMNNVVVMTCEAILQMIDNENENDVPKIVELARAARRHADPLSKLRAETTRWEIGRDEILRTMESPDVSPEFRALLQEMDIQSKKARELLDEAKKYEK